MRSRKSHDKTDIIDQGIITNHGAEVLIRIIDWTDNLTMSLGTGNSKPNRDDTALDSEFIREVAFVSHPEMILRRLRLLFDLDSEIDEVDVEFYASFPVSGLTESEISEVGVFYEPDNLLMVRYVSHPEPFVIELPDEDDIKVVIPMKIR